MNEHETNILLDRLIPAPQKAVFQDGDFVIQDKCRFHIRTGESVSAELVERKVRRYWNVLPSFTFKKEKKAAVLKKEAYRISITPDCVEVTASGEQGVDYALKTLRQLAEPERGGSSFRHSLLPCGEIEDEPKLNFRGMHFCIFPETPMWVIEKQIRLAAYCKFNYAVIESWGVFPFRSHPEFCWKDKVKRRYEFRRLLDVAAEEGISLIPQLNILGHASASRISTGKHAVLDFNPALQPLFEPDGWCWCLTNPETRRVLTDLVTELYEFFDSPPYFHIGCDEADSIATCRDCRKRKTETLVLDHLGYFHDLMKEKGARAIMWHDMLLTIGDPRWRGYIVCGHKEQGLGELYKKLPKDIIIADWQYGNLPEENKNPEWPTSLFFKKAEFDVLTCPWMEPQGTLSLGKMAERETLFGLLGTTWHTCYADSFKNMFYHSACAAWGGNQERAGIFSISRERLSIARHLRQIGWDMNLAEYEQTGDVEYQVFPETVQYR